MTGNGKAGTVKMNFQKQIEISLKKSGLKQSEYAAKICVSTVTLWRWLNGKCKPKPDAIDYWIFKIKDIK